MWGLFEIISEEQAQQLVDFQKKHYPGTKLGDPTRNFRRVTRVPVKYPTTDEVDREMKKPPKHPRQVS